MTQPVPDPAENLDAAADQGDINQPEMPAMGAPDPEGAETLGDPGKKALDAMKARERAAREAARVAKAEADELRAKLADQDRTEDERRTAEAQRTAQAEANARANKRIVKAEIRAAATATFEDPADALAFLDLDKIEVSDDGEVDVDAVKDALADLLERKPHLGKRTATVPQPKPDTSQGPRPNTQTVEDAEYAAFKAKLWPSHQPQ